MHITDVELMEPPFWFGLLELNEDTNIVTYIRKYCEGKGKGNYEGGIVKLLLSWEWGKDTVLSNKYNMDREIIANEQIEVISGWKITERKRDSL